MKNVKRVSVFALGLVLTVAFVPLPANAQSNNRPANTEARCTVAKEKITNRIATITEQQTNRASKYESIATRVDAFITKATDAGYTNVDKLTTARNNVKATIEAHTTKAAAYQAALEDVQSMACGESVGAYMSALAKARTELKALRIDSEAVKAAVKEQAVPALRDYATWLKTNSTEIQEDE